MTGTKVTTEVTHRSLIPCVTCKCYSIRYRDFCGISIVLQQRCTRRKVYDYYALTDDINIPVNWYYYVLFNQLCTVLSALWSYFVVFTKSFFFQITTVTIQVKMIELLKWNRPLSDWNSGCLGMFVDETIDALQTSENRKHVFRKIYKSFKIR
jgi:hypothetical protein